MSFNHNQSSEWPYSPFFHSYYRPYPPIEVTRFQRSAATCTNLMEQGKKLLDKVNKDAQFAHELKDAAQKNDQSHVHSLIQAAGVTSPFHLSYTPDAIRIDFNAGNDDRCSEFTVKLCW
ncbi:hypothetical protein [Guptibacillus spartinae]|uniref:hypothetical protein n=1 Tax=Guptibacillus spartinae TaxID=3025679 RepID=UPI00235F83A0|nr:hypothetical protein [Pseudalkalibacillus spartinae]